MTKRTTSVRHFPCTPMRSAADRCGHSRMDAVSCTRLRCGILHTVSFLHMCASRVYLRTLLGLNCLMFDNGLYFTSFTFRYPLQHTRTLFSSLYAKWLHWKICFCCLLMKIVTRYEFHLQIWSGFPGRRKRRSSLLLPDACPDSCKSTRELPMPVMQALLLIPLSV